MDAKPAPPLKTAQWGFWVLPKSHYTWNSLIPTIPAYTLQSHEKVGSCNAQQHNANKHLLSPPVERLE